MGNIKNILDIDINENSGIPLYQQLYAELKKSILSGNYKTGDRLPSVSAICSNFNLSIGTVTRALNEIEREGLINSRRGAGIFVSPHVHSIEAVVPFFPITTISPDGILNHDQRFVAQFMNGLRKPLNNTQYRLSLTYMSGPPPTASETINICNARRAIGLIEYRSSPEFLSELKKVSMNIPVVSLSGDLHDEYLGCVACKPDKQLQVMLNSRFERSNGKIVFASRDSDILGGTYRAIYDAYIKICNKHSIKPEATISESNKKRQEGIEELTKDIVSRMKLKAGDTIVTLSPYMGGKLAEVCPGLDVIAYTESSHSVQLYEKNISFLYLGIDTIATEGVKLLMGSNKMQLPLKKPLHPEILEKKEL